MAGDVTIRPLAELRDSGLLWLINRVVFHPRGFALGLELDGEGAVVGWKLIGDGSEPWTMLPPEPEFDAAERTLAEAREQGNG